jgi:hypothetical protein
MSVQVLSTPPADAHIAACGLFCSNCGKYKSDRCKGCQTEPGFSRCPVRACVVEKGITSCADCADFAAPRDYRECPKLNNFMSKIFSFVFRSDRVGALTLLRDEGEDAYLTAKGASGKM